MSKWNTYIKYSEELRNTAEDVLLELSKSEGTFYRKAFTTNLESGILVDKFENGKVEKVKVPVTNELKLLKNEDIIFQYDIDGGIKVRQDLKKDVIRVASEKLAVLKEEQDKRAKEYKQEGHTYNVCEDDGYVFLTDITEEKGTSIEDIDFIVDDYHGDGMYKVVNGKYVKIGDLPK